MPASLIARLYEVGPAIGSGAAGMVYLGWDTRSGERVAIKQIHGALLADAPELLDGFYREAQALRRLRHPNIIQLLTSWEAGDDHYLVMEYARGGSVADLLGRQPQLPIDRALAIGLGVAAALTDVHAMGLLHRDVKPSNILLSADGTPRLTDFGLACLSCAAPSIAEPAGTGSCDGTFAYMSPEAWRLGRLDGRTDIWSLGVVLFEMLAGRRPFGGDSPYEMMWAIENEPLPDVRDYRDGLPSGLGDLMQRMLMRDVAARISSARLVCKELAQIQKSREEPMRVGAHHAFRSPMGHGYCMAQGLG